jgi:hypothetical protein
MPTRTEIRIDNRIDSEFCYFRVGRIPNNRPDVTEIGRITGWMVNGAGRIGPDVK